MKDGIHPEMRPVVFKDSSNQEHFITLSTLRSDKTVEVDGVEYPLVWVEISSSSHPYYTGKQRVVDTEGRILRFQKKLTTLEEKKKK